LKLANSIIETSTDAQKDNLDLVLFAGGRNNQGDAATGSVDNSEVVGGVRVEYSQSADKRGVDAELYQAKLDRSIALQDKLQKEEDLQYELASLLAEYKAGNKALGAYKTSVKSEKNKLDEALSRYRRGRTDTDQLIQFESHLSSAELSLELQRIELSRRYYKVNLLTGDVWSKITLREFVPPDFSASDTNTQGMK
jgi:outer membrane protein TolC